MWEYLFVLAVGFWLGVAIFLYVSCFWIEEIFDLPTRSSSPCQSSGASGAHAQLKRLVARVVEEATSLPALSRYAREPSRTPPIESSTYEDLLATAILNKVIERYQHENGSGGRSSGIHSASASPTPSERSSPRSLHSGNTRDISPPLREEEEDVSDWEEGETTDDALELPKRVPFPEFGGDVVHRTGNEDRDFDEVSGSDIQAVDGSWEENWLFQKKKIKTIQSVPVPMLVPNSSTEYRALIGDRDADDTTDLSDNGSDAEDEETEFKSDIKKVLESKHVIGGKTKIDDILDFEPDSLTILDYAQDFEKEEGEKYVHSNVVDAANSKMIEQINDFQKNEEGLDNNVEINNESVLILGVDSGPAPKTEFSLKEEIHRTVLNGKVEDYTDEITVNITKKHLPVDNEDLDTQSNNKSSSNTLSRHERESEYEETVTVPVQRYADSLRRKHFDDVSQEIPTRDTDKEEDLIPGSIAYRERQKWLNYVEMPNNPYSPEAIKKRLNAKNTSSLFDMITIKSKDVSEEDNSTLAKDVVDSKDSIIYAEEVPEKETSEKKNLLTANTSITNLNVTDGKDRSPSPKILKDVLADEIPEYKRYGRDYYIKEAKAASGGRKKSSFSDTSSLSPTHKSFSLDQFDSELASPVSASSSLSDLEASALHQNIVRAVLSPRNASTNFAINPIFEYSDRQNENEPLYTDDRKVRRRANGLLIKQINSIATNQQYNNFADKTNESDTIWCEKTEILIEYDDIDERTLFSAEPANVDEETDKKIEEILEAVYNHEIPIKENKSKSFDEPPKSPLNADDSYVSSSSLDDSIKVYNVQTGKIVTSKGDNISERYETPDSNDNIDIPDNNISAETLDSLSYGDDAQEDSLGVEVVEKENSETESAIAEEEETISKLPSVRELAKKFVSMDNLNSHSKVDIMPHEVVHKRRQSIEDFLNGDKSEKPANKHAYMHSLTARSLSKEFREGLKMSLATPLKVPGGLKDSPEGTHEIISEATEFVEPLPKPGTIKSKLAFFESLKSRVNRK